LAEEMRRASFGASRLSAALTGEHTADNAAQHIASGAS